MSTFASVLQGLHAGGNECRRWIRFHGTTATNEPDASANAPISNATPSPLDANSLPVSPTMHAAGPHLSGETTWSWTISNVRLNRNSPVNLGNADFLTANSATTGSILLFYKGTSATNQVLMAAHPTGLAFLVWVLSDGTMQLQAINNADSRTQTTVPVGSGGVNLLDGAWHMLTLCSDGANPNKLYIDGVSRTYTEATGGTGLTSHFWVNAISPYTVAQYRFGNDARAPTTNDFPVVASVSELVHMGVAFSASDVLALWLASQSGPTPINGTTRRVLGYRRGFAA